MANTKLWSTVPELSKVTSGPVPYTGFVSQGKYSNGTWGAGTTFGKYRNRKHARAEMLGARFLYTNMSGSGASTAGTTTIQEVAIEYPVGTLTPVTFNGATTATMTGQTIIVSDPLTISIPDGAMYYEWVRVSNPTGINYVTGSTFVDKGLGTTSNTTAIGSGALTGMTDMNNTYTCLAVIGTTTKPSVLIIGNSRDAGNGFNRRGTNDTGPIAGAISGNLGYVNMSVGGASLWQFSTDNGTVFDVIVNSLKNYYTRLAICDMINDINGGNNVAALKLCISKIRNRWVANTKVTYAITTAPYTTSTDSFATTTNQTVWDVTKEAVRVSWNAALMSGDVDGIYRTFDTASAVEDTTKAGVYKAPGYVGTDGLHVTIKGEIAQLATIDPAAFGVTDANPFG
jgi:hypothetical protein